MGPSREVWLWGSMSAFRHLNPTLNFLKIRISWKNQCGLLTSLVRRDQGLGSHLKDQQIHTDLCLQTSSSSCVAHEVTKDLDHPVLWPQTAPAKVKEAPRQEGQQDNICLACCGATAPRAELDPRFWRPRSLRRLPTAQEGGLSWCTVTHTSTATALNVDSRADLHKAF